MITRFDLNFALNQINPDWTPFLTLSEFFTYLKDYNCKLPQHPQGVTRPSGIVGKLGPCLAIKKGFI